MSDHWYDNDETWENLAAVLFTRRRWEKAEIEIGLLLTLLGLTGDETILDIPCGTGRHALELARQGAHVVVNDLGAEPDGQGRSDGPAGEVVDAIASQGGQAIANGADVADWEAAGALVKSALERFGRLDAVVNNAGVAPQAPIPSTDEDLVYGTFAINTFGPMHLIARAWPIFVRQGEGCIVNVSSLASSDPFPGFFVYAATKSAIESLTRSAAREGEVHGIRAYSVAPGAVEAPTLRRLFSEEDIPRELTLDPLDVARVVGECVTGNRPEGSGSVIVVAKSP